MAAALAFEEANPRFTIKQLIHDKSDAKNMRRLALCFLLQFFQQFTGINVIAFYGTLFSSWLYTSPFGSVLCSHDRPGAKRRPAAGDGESRGGLHPDRVLAWNVPPDDSQRPLRTAQGPHARIHRAAHVHGRFHGRHCRQHAAHG